MGVQRLRSVSAFFFLFFGLIAGVAEGTPTMAGGNPVKLLFPVGTTTTLNMRTLLVDPANPLALKWQTGGAKPTWVVLTGDNMAATPPAGGVSNFILSVCEPAIPPAEEKCDFRNIELTAGRPPVWASTDLGKWDEGSTLKIDLTTLATQPDGEKLTFTIEDPRTNASWLSINGNFLQGSPLRANLGAFDLILVATTPLGFSAKKKAFGEVRKVPVAPKFLVNPMVLSDATEDLGYSQTMFLPAWVSHPEPEPVTFAVTAGKPNWLTFNSDGSMSGTPLRANKGAVSLTVQLTQVVDGKTFNDTAVVKFNVLTVNKAPQWSKNPIVLADAPVKKLVSQDLSSFASDIDGNTLTYRKVSGPAWADVTGKGVFTGTPQNGDIGPWEFVVEVSDGALTAQTKVQIKIFNTPPTWLANPIVLKNGQEGTELAEDLRTYARDVDGDLLSFELLTGPAWVVVNTDGTVKGTPGNVDIGLNTFTVKVTDGFSAPVQVNVQITVVRKPPVPPKFLVNPMGLPDAPEDLLYSQTMFLPNWVSHPEPEPVTFKVTAGKPNWLTFNSDGSMSGTPVRADKGLVSLTVQLTQVVDGKTFTDTGVVKFNVVTVNKAPQWSKNPIVLPDAPVKKLVSQDLSSFASDIDGNPLTYKKISGPAWADVTVKGVFTGTPQNADIGPWEFVLEVSDGLLTAQTKVQIKVFNTPPAWLANPVVLKHAQEDFDFAEDLRTYAKDADGDLLSFEPLSGPAWVVINMDGTVKGTPRRIDLGLNTIPVKVSDGFNPAVQVNVQITVDRTNKAPEWTTNPIVLKDAPERSPYTETIAPFAKDIDGDAMTFEKVTGPAWVKIAADGSVSGTPLRADVGVTSAVVRVKDKAGLSATATVTINVLKVNRPPVWSINPITLPDATEGSPFTFALAPLVTDADGDALVFKKTTGPVWQVAGANGQLSGTPGELDIGNYSVTFEVFDGDVSVPVNATGRVLKANKAPRWSQDPIVLVPNGRAEESYQNDLAAFASDPDGDKLTFRKLSGPGWATISTNGLFSGLPKKTDVGLNTFTAEVSDGKLTAVVTIKLQVDKAFEPPKWAQDPLLLPDALEGAMFSFNLLPLVTDPENDPLTFRIVRGPAWLTTSPQGQLNGIPQKSDVGSFTAVFEVSDGRFQVSVGATGRVIPRNDPPVINQNALVFAVKERATLSVDLTDPQYLKDPDGDKLTFNLLDAKDWVVLTTAGKLTLTPKHKDLGDYVLKFTVADTKNAAVNGTLTIQVQPDPKPPTWKTDPIRFTTKAGKLFTQNLVGFVTDINGLPLTFNKKTGPAWLAINTDGTITGTPSESDVGEGTFLVTATSDGPGSDVTLIVTVLSGNAAPIWAKDPITLPDAMVNLAYSQSLLSYVTDPDGDPLKFEKLSGPDWAFLTSAGLFIGVPETKDLGVGQFRVRVKDSKNAFADVTVLIQVKKPNLPPDWKTNPLNLGDAVVKLPFNFALPPWVNNPDNDALTFKKISGPTWLQVTTDGQAFGTPKDADLGAYTAVFEVSDGQASVRVDAFGQVIKGNMPPKLNLGNLVFTVKERQTLAVDLNQPIYVQDPENDTLTFSIVNAPAWVNLSSAGALNLTPQKENIGDHTFQLRVTDSKNQTVEGPMLVKVIADPRKPIWLEDPIQFTAMENKFFQATVADRVHNPAAGNLTFAKVSGPAWLTVGVTGNLSGTPKKSDIGTNTFVVSATNGEGSANVNVIIDVKKNDSEGDDSIRIDDAVPGARADNLWVIDNSPTCNGPGTCLIYDLQRNIDVYFAALDKAGIHHLGVYYSSDACRYVKPIRDSWKRLLISWEDKDNAESFNERLAASKGEAKYNSPLTQMVRFFNDIPGSAEIGEFYEADVPLDAMVITAHPDHYSTFQGAGSSTRGWGVSDFISFYKKTASAAKKPFRISAIAPKCPTTAFPSVYSESDSCYKAYPKGVNPYQQMANETSGTFYAYHTRTSVRDSLLDYADKVIFGATVRAHKKIPLSGTPSDVSKIVVKLAGNVITGNTGNATDKWSYESSTNSVVIHWEQIDMGTLKPGDRIEITYPKLVRAITSAR